MSKTLHILVVLSVLIALVGAGADNKSTTTTTTAKPTTTTTTTKTTTTTAKPTTTTTTAKPTTTTTKKTTTAKTTTSTTVKPSTTKQPMTTIRPTPSPSTEPPRGSWNVTGKNGVVCVLLDAGIRFTFQYKDSSGKDMSVSIDLPATNQSAPPSVCGSTEVLAIDFSPIIGAVNKTWRLQLEFNQTATKSREFFVSSIQLRVIIDNHLFRGINASLIGENVTLTKVSDSLYKNDVGTSYQCDSHKNVTDFKSSLEGFGLVSLETDQLKLEAFRTTNTTTFSAANPCPEDSRISNIVPIAVGAALAGLVVIVLVAYLIGRRRTKRGYESV